MSNPLAIAAVTATLRELITEGIHDDHELVDATVTTQPPDKARSDNKNQVNIFLYHTSINAALRNTYLPDNLRHGEAGNPPLALNLYYLITAYGKDDDDILGHRLLSRSMSTLHDHPILETEEIRNSLSGNDLYEQVEKVRITPQSITPEDMSKLWTIFQTQYRISAAYEASVIIIDSNRPVRSPLPVLNRGDTGRGATVLASQSPSIQALKLPEMKSSVELGDTLIIRGEHLDGEVKFYFINKHLDEPIDIFPESHSSVKVMRVTISKNSLLDTSIWVAGMYTVYAVVKREGQPSLMTNELPLSLAPQITNRNPSSSARGDVNLTLSVKPKIRPGQRVHLLLGDRQIPAEPRSSSTDTLNFSFNIDKPGNYLLRLRVDGVDSMPIDRDSKPPRFDDDQKVTIT